MRSRIPKEDAIRLKPEIVEKALKVHNAGTYIGISREYGVHRDTVLKWLKEALKEETK